MAKTVKNVKAVETKVNTVGKKIPDGEYDVDNMNIIFNKNGTPHFRLNEHLTAYMVNKGYKGIALGKDESDENVIFAVLFKEKELNTLEEKSKKTNKKYACKLTAANSSKPNKQWRFSNVTYAELLAEATGSEYCIIPVIDKDEIDDKKHTLLELLVNEIEEKNSTKNNKPKIEKTKEKVVLEDDDDEDEEEEETPKKKLKQKTTKKQKTKAEPDDDDDEDLDDEDDDEDDTDEEEDDDDDEDDTDEEEDDDDEDDDEDEEEEETPKKKSKQKTTKKQKTKAEPDDDEDDDDVDDEEEDDDDVDDDEDEDDDDDEEEKIVPIRNRKRSRIK